MINKVIRPSKDGKGVYKNKGSCAPLVNYLSKEDKKLGDEREYFFDHENDIVLSSQVENTIDSLRKGLGKDDTKFYSLVLAPTEDEIKCMKDPREEMRAYTRAQMEIYAANFNGLNKPKNLTGKDIAYFAKIEFDRYYKGSDQEVKDGIVKQGDKKPGHNLHVHIVVARKDRSNTYKISPLVKNKKLFHIEGFKLKACYLFDEMYNREGAAMELERMMIKRDGNDLGVKAYEAYKPKLTISDLTTSIVDEKPLNELVIDESKIKDTLLQPPNIKTKIGSEIKENEIKNPKTKKQNRPKF